MYSYQNSTTTGVLIKVKVSILIQVVNVFLYSKRRVFRRPRWECLNPYSGGKCIPIIMENSNEIKKQIGLNPYSGGKCIPI